MIKETVLAHLDAAFGGSGEDRLHSEDGAQAEIEKAFKEIGISSETRNPKPETRGDFRALLEQKSAEVAENPLARNQLLSVLDMLWMTNLEDLEALSESVGLRAYGQRDPLVEYRQEASKLFRVFWSNYNQLVFSNIFKLLENGERRMENGAARAIPPSVVNPQSASPDSKIGRNDPCPCGSGRKWKKCHGK
ncbi:MAG: SEC-C domain-containing protein [Patescibacteria group bacterium]|nr:SEC-C domain-containing protein [Patescibacteria group bacterium]